MTSPGTAPLHALAAQATQGAALQGTADTSEGSGTQVSRVALQARQDKQLIAAMAPLLGGYHFKDAALLREVRPAAHEGRARVLLTQKSHVSGNACSHRKAM